MGHRKGDSSTYLQYYMSNFIDVDCQSICFGTAPQHDLVHLAARLRRHDDAPKALTVQQLSEIEGHESLDKYRKKRTRAMIDWKNQGYGSRKQAEGTEMAERYDRYQKKIDTLRKHLKAERLQRSIREFHTSVHVEEIDRQLRGIKPSDAIAPPNIEYDLPERAKVASLFSQAADITDRGTLHLIRIELITTLAQLCKRRESPCRGSDKRGRKSVASKAMTRSIRSRAQVSLRYESEDADDRFSPSLGGSATYTPDPSRPTCPFCQWHGTHGESQRRKTWRLDSLARHVRDQHLKRKRAPFLCPWPDCEAVLADSEHFASHAARHNLDLPPTVLRG